MAGGSLPPGAEAESEGWGFFGMERLWLQDGCPLQSRADELCSLFPPWGGGGSHGVNSPLLCSAPRLPLHSFQLTVEMFDYMDCELRLSESGKLTKEEAQPTRVQCDSSGPTAR